MKTSKYIPNAYTGKPGQISSDCVELSADCVRLGNRIYAGEVVNEPITALGTLQYDCKVYRYPSGKYQVVKASNKVFRLPIPGALPREYNVKPVQTEMYYNIYGTPLTYAHRYYILKYRLIYGPLKYDTRVFRRSHAEGVFFSRRLREPKDPHDKQREDNVLRARTRLQQIILSNEWLYFVTVTFNDQIQDARNAPQVLQKLQRWLKNQTYRYNVGYLLVAEYHKKDQRIHAHFLCKGDLKVVFNDIYKVKHIKRPVTGETVRRYHLQDRIQYPVYNVSGWKLGFSTAIEVYGSPARLANYVLKYITKQSSKIFGKSYWASKNIKLYPTVELSQLPFRDYDLTIAKQYYHRGSKAAFKYINKTGDIIQDMADSDPDEQEVLKL